MSETQEKVQAPVISRNNVSKELVKQTFGKKSNHAGKTFFAPETSSASFENDVKWAGLDWFVAILNKQFRRIFADIHIDNIDENSGEFNADQWRMDAEDFTAGVAKLSDLQEDLDELVGIQQEIALDDEFGADTDRGQELTAKVVELNHKIKPIRAQIANIRAKYADRAAKRAAKEQASKTKQAEGETVTA